MSTTRPSPLFFWNEQGQAATEFLIAAVYVLVPLFLVIPLVGKYIDVKQALIQEARFEAWEYTAWFMDKKRMMDFPRHHPNIRSAVRPWQETRQAGEVIFLSDITSFDYGKRQGESPVTANPLWRDNRGTSLLTGGDTVVLEGSLRETDTPNPSGKNIINDLLTIINDISEAVKKVLKFEGQHAGFDALNSKGFFKSKVSLSLRSPGEVIPCFSLAGDKNSSGTPLKFTGKAAVLTDCWNAGSTKNAIGETKGLVLSSLLHPLSHILNTLIDDAQRVLNHLKIEFKFKIFGHKFDLGKIGIDAELPNAPSFGYVKNGLIPYEHLKDNTREIKSYKGLYYYKEE